MEGRNHQNRKELNESVPKYLSRNCMEVIHLNRKSSPKEVKA